MIFNPTDKERALIFLNKLFERKRKIKIEPVSETKTINQIRYIHMVFAHIADQCGDRMESAKKHYKKQFPKYEEITFKGETELIQITSLADFSKEQMSIFIDEVVTDGRQEGFDIPDCEDKKAMDLYDYYRSRGII